LGRDRYEWTKEGRDRYKVWWKDRLIKTHEDVIPASDDIARAANSSWWNWDDGSTPFHWRWPLHYQRVIRDGLKVYFQERPPRYLQAQRDIPDKEVKKKVIEKLAKVRKRGYISAGLV
jgi:hypothetical protein